MTDYISKTEFYRSLMNDIHRINTLTWSDFIPISQQHLLPDQGGIILLLDKKKELIFPASAASNTISRRVSELLEDKENRYKDTEYVRYCLEENQNIRFSTRTDIKHILLRIETPIEQFSNVLDDNDPRIKARNEYLHEEFSNNKLKNTENNSGERHHAYQKHGGANCQEIRHQ